MRALGACVRAPCVRSCCTCALIARTHMHERGCAYMCASTCFCLRQLEGAHTDVCVHAQTQLLRNSTPPFWRARAPLAPPIHAAAINTRADECTCAVCACLCCVCAYACACRGAPVHLRASARGSLGSALASTCFVPGMSPLQSESCCLLPTSD